MKIIFMGTPAFSVPVLEALASSRHEVTAVYTQPDEEKGRGKKVAFSPVKEAAIRLGIPVFQPASLRKSAAKEELFAIDADVIIVAAYGKILKKEVLECKRFGCINVHASLLPAYRGAAPAQWTILNGESVSGVTIMQMDEGLDTGDILASEPVTLSPDETTGTLLEKLSAVGGPLLLSVLDRVEDGTAVRTPQGDTTTAYASMIDKAMGLVDFTAESVSVERLIRAMDPWPSAYTHRNGALLKLWKASVVNDLTEEEAAAEPGTVIRVSKHDFTVRTGDGALTLFMVQPEGKKRMTASEYVRGYRIAVGEKLGE